jgi:hypothetical protein
MRLRLDDSREPLDQRARLDANEDMTDVCQSMLFAPEKPERIDR